MTNPPEIARLLYQKVNRVLSDTETDLPEKTAWAFSLLNNLFLHATEQEKLRFSDFGSRIAYAGHKYGIPGKELYLVYEFRRRYLKKTTAPGIPDIKQEDLDLGILALSQSIRNLTSENIPEDLQALLPSPVAFRRTEVEIQRFMSYARVVLLKDIPEDEQFLGIDEEHPDREIRIAYNITGRNHHFNPSISLIKKVFGFPLSVNLTDVEVCENGSYRPKGFVILPDYLTDITSVSECFSHDGAYHELYLLKKFIPVEASKYLITGNIANKFLDDILGGRRKPFQEHFKDCFPMYPVQFSRMADEEIREIYTLCRGHHSHLTATVDMELEDQGIKGDHAYLEPTFYSREYGLQGRLDLWYNNEQSGKSAIVELKSGKLFRPNRYGLNHNHYIQTMLYDLLVKSVYKNEGIKPTNYILYSRLERERLRFAPVSTTHQSEAMQLRNFLISIEHQLTRCHAEDSGPLNILASGRTKNWQGFNAKDKERLLGAIGKLSPLEKKYFLTMTGFIAREHIHAKVGSSVEGRSTGQADLWAKSYSEKNDNYEILSRLDLSMLPSAQGEPVLGFRRTEHTNPLANFRSGDIGVLYPYDPERSTVLRHRIFKCTIININADWVEVRLRAEQHHLEDFKKHAQWNIEHDLFDSGFNQQYKQLLLFSESPKEKRDLFLGIKPPSVGEEREISIPYGMTQEQGEIFQSMVNMGDLFLLWGPPGTGKTNMMLRNLAGYLMDFTSENVLLLTYTNRAADEICDAIEMYHPGMRNKYFRIGSKYSTGLRFRERLLNRLMEEANDRKDVKAIIEGHRIVVATVSSMLGKRDLLHLKTFDRVIIDEASQITEPMLAGLLPAFPKVIMIGDHKQLPAVTVQDPESCRVVHEGLHGIGLKDLRASLFERLYLHYLDQGWHHALGRLSHQGRMHADIMAFPNEMFYEGKLATLPESIPHGKAQLSPLEFVNEPQGDLEKLLSEQRVIFLPSTTDDRDIMAEKSNHEEAVMMTELIDAFERLYGDEFKISDIGIITPFRAQIANIRHVLHRANRNPDDLTIDTVERYQGGARKIILISVCANSTMRLSSIVSARDENDIDRKLNVALTRAKEHLVMVGNPEVLKADPRYREFIRLYGVNLPVS